jgi:hypothetical protein
MDTTQHWKWRRRGLEQPTGYSLRRPGAGYSQSGAAAVVDQALDGPRASRLVDTWLAETLESIPR